MVLYYRIDAYDRSIFCNAVCSVVSDIWHHPNVLDFDSGDIGGLRDERIWRNTMA
jgi:hypothetical protein